MMGEATELAGKNGLARNIAKLKLEWKSWKVGMERYVEQYHDAKGIGQKLHKAMNLVTESFRGWPYLWAHIIVYATMLVALVALAVRFI